MANNICVECNKSFETAAKLKKHIQGIHERDRKYGCLGCSKTFSIKVKMKEHIAQAHCVFDHRHRPRTAIQMANLKIFDSTQSHQRQPSSFIQYEIIDQVIGEGLEERFWTQVREQQPLEHPSTAPSYSCVYVMVRGGKKDLAPQGRSFDIEGYRCFLRNIFYVGSGINGRYFHHEVFPDNYNYNSDKFGVIDELKSKGDLPTVITAYTGCTEAESRMIESMLIATFGLENLTNENAGSAHLNLDFTLDELHQLAQHFLERMYRGFLCTAVHRHCSKPMESNAEEPMQAEAIGETSSFKSTSN